MSMYRHPLLSEVNSPTHTVSSFQLILVFYSMTCTGGCGYSFQITPDDGCCDTRNMQSDLENSMQSNTTMSQKVYLVIILGNYMFRLVLAIFMLSQGNLRSYYKHCARTWCRDLYIRALFGNNEATVEVCLAGMMVLQPSTHLQQVYYFANKAPMQRSLHHVRELCLQ